ncbi:hypothetical protein SBY92_004709 [Candida maltosa Xu316]
MSNQPPNYNSSSSDDEDDRNVRQQFHIQLPQHQLNLSEVRKQNFRKHEKPTIAKQTASNLAKAKKITTGSNHNFGKSNSQKQSGSSSNYKNKFIPSTRNSDNSDDSSDDEFRPDDNHRNVFQDNNNNVSNMKFNSEGIKPSPFDNENSSDDDDGDDDVEDETHIDFSHFNQNHPHQQFYQTDSSDDEARDEHPEMYNIPGSSSSAAGGAAAHDVHSERRSSMQSGESSGKRSNTSNNTGGIKGILRKMSLVDRHLSNDGTNQDISHGDTFLGRVLNFGNNNGLSGGGLAPGASIREEPEPDEEKRVGFAANENDRDGIELQPLNFDSLSEEAKQLIHQHIPNASVPHSTDITPSQSPKSHSVAPEEKEPEDTEETRRRKSEERKKAADPFYTPNPDLFLRGTAVTDSQNEEMNQEDDFMNTVAGDYIAPPKQVQAGVLSSLLRLYQNPQEERSASSLSRTTTGTTAVSYDDSFDSNLFDKTSSNLTADFNKLKSGIKGAPKASRAMFNKATHKFKHHSSGSETKLSTSSDDEKHGDGSGDDGDDDVNMAGLPSFQNAKPKIPKKPNDPVNNKLKKLRHNNKRAERLRITVHIADILQRQRFIMNMCRALMMFGAPTHRLEEYMVMTSRVLEIDGQFIYFPGCMLVSFGDAATRTSEVHLVRCAQGLNLSKLADTHKIYKAVIHDLIGVEDASRKLDDLLKSKNRYPPWLCVLIYGIGSLAVTPFAFEGGALDLPISFGVGLCVGYLQFYLSSMSNLYSSVFEVSAAIVVSFIARAIATIHHGRLFCFSAIAQGSLAIILPGYIILCGSLELQSRNLVAGAVRFGITLGAALYGWIDKNAISENSCAKGHPMDDKWRILFVPLFASSLGLINQARWTQLPVMALIAGVSYIATYFAGKHFSQVTEFTACIGAFIVGILGNLYSRIWKGMAVSAMLPAIFVQVPSGIASKSTLISGLQTADQITNKNGTSQGTSSLTDASSLSFGASMVEVSIGISVGLFAAALVVYPFGKRRTGLFAL